MALVVTGRGNDTGAGASGTANKTTASFTPSANSLLVMVATVQREGHTTASAWTISDTAWLTWTQRALSSNIAGNFGGDIILWTAPVGASPAAMTITIDPFATTITGWIGYALFDITGHDTTTPLPQSAVANTTTSTGNSVSLTVTLGSAPTSGNLVIGVFTGQNDAAGGFTSISGFTELYNPTTANDHVGVWYRTNTTTAAITCTDLGQSVNWGAAVALEIAAAGGGAAAPPPRTQLVRPGLAAIQASTW